MVTLLLAGALVLAASGGLVPDASAAASASVIREASTSAPECGTSLTITLAIDWSGLDGGPTALTIEENFPSAWTVASITNGGASGVAGRATWFITDPGLQQVQYTLEIPQDAEGAFSLSGDYRDSSLESSDPNKQVGGLESLQVTCDEAQNGEDGEDSDTGDDPVDPGDGPGISRQVTIGQECGTPFTVTLLLDWGTTRDGMMFFIEETFPAGWLASGATNGGSVDTSAAKWWLTDPSVESVSYQLTPPDELEGSGTFTGEFRDDLLAAGEASRTITGDDQVQVTCVDEPDPVTAHVEREELINSECSDLLEVRLLIQWNDAQTLTIREGYPEGWSLASGASGADLSVPGQITWMLQGGSPSILQYTLQVPEDAEGTFSFIGTFDEGTTLDDGSGLDVGGDDQVTVFCDQEPADDQNDEENDGSESPEDQTEAGSVTRMIETVCTGTFTVTLQVEPGEGTSAWFLDEIVPDGLELVSAGGGDFNEAARAIRWVQLDGDAATISYQLAVPEDTPDGTGFQWNGEFRFHPAMEERAPVLGDDNLQTGCLSVHPFDQDSDCVFSDDEVFALVDAWKVENADDAALFAGIDAWKLHPQGYC